ncbi:MAG TPA: hypothetical protein ENK96_06505 [Desulfobulbaceae bacterium]|nr:hypothetical protein [Desulfobulbaceae bacterium]
MSTLPEIKKILYVTDLGKHTRPVFRFALSQARHYKAELLMLHVVEPGRIGAGALLSQALDHLTHRTLGGGRGPACVRA